MCFLKTFFWNKGKKKIVEIKMSNSLAGFWCSIIIVHTNKIDIPFLIFVCKGDWLWKQINIMSIWGFDTIDKQLTFCSIKWNLAIHIKHAFLPPLAMSLPNRLWQLFFLKTHTYIYIYNFWSGRKEINFGGFGQMECSRLRSSSYKIIHGISMCGYIYVRIYFALSFTIRSFLRFALT